MDASVDDTDHVLLVTVTERRTKDDIDRYDVEAIEKALVG